MSEHGKRIRVFIVDDQTLVREGFRKLLEFESDFEILGTASDGESAIATIERFYAGLTPPDVVLMDIRMPRLDGIETTRALKACWSAIRIIILTTFDDIELIQAGLQAGALGYLLKDVTSEQLASTIRAAANGEVLLQPEIATKVFAALKPTTTPTPAAPKTSPNTAPTQDKDYAEPLTEREKEVLTLVARGASNRQIAESLYLAEGTIKNHMSNILGKLGVRDRTQAALKAREMGLS